MTSQTENRIRGRAVNSTVITALAAGIYVSTFYISNNFTMLSTASVLFVAIALTVPIVALVLLSNLVLSALKREAYADFLAMFICGLFLMLALRVPVFDNQFIREIRGQLHGGTWLVAHAIYFIVPAMLISVIFRKNAGRLTIVLMVMMITAVTMGFRGASLNVPANSAERNLMKISLNHKPNIYLILVDGFASFSYLDEYGIDVSVFKDQLLEKDFRLYDDTFANYHATTDSMLSMLDMRHHYYGSTRKFSEISKSAREVIGGGNNLIRLLKRNGYRTEYVHQGNYLLLQGCAVDYCFPSFDAFFGARNVFREILPKVLIGGETGKWEMQALGVIKKEIVRRVEPGSKPTLPRFQYVHIYEPGHAGNDVVGICDEAEELAKYSQKVSDVSIDIVSIVDDIILPDPGAVIVISGDHGPFITNQCRRKVDLSTPGEYRDRVGAVTAIRWPNDYDGRYDGGIMTNANLFRFLLASLVDNGAEILSTRVSDDVFVHGDQGILKIIGNGQILVPPETYSMKEMREFYRQELTH